MPLFDYTCESCAVTREHFLTVSEVGIAIQCEKCGRAMHKHPISKVNAAIERPVGAIMSNGQVVKGLFGKDAPRRRKHVLRSS